MTRSANVATVQRRMLEAGVACARCSRCASGYGARVPLRAPDQAPGGRSRARSRPVASTSRSSIKSDDELGAARARRSTGCGCGSRSSSARAASSSATLRTSCERRSSRCAGFLELMTDEELDEESTRREFLETMREPGRPAPAPAPRTSSTLTRLDAGRMHIERAPDRLAASCATDLHDEFRAVAIATAHDAQAGRRRGLRARGRGAGRPDRPRARSRMRSSTRRPGRVSRVAVEVGSSLVGRTTGQASRPSMPRRSSERFYRVDGATGLRQRAGRSRSRASFAEAMGGRSRLDSTAGRTTFTLRLPPARFPVETDGGADERFVPAGEGKNPRDEVATDATPVEIGRSRFGRRNLWVGYEPRMAIAERTRPRPRVRTLRGRRLSATDDSGAARVHHALPARPHRAGPAPAASRTSCVADLKLAAHGGRVELGQACVRRRRMARSRSRTSSTDDRLVIEVNDEGEGFDPADDGELRRPRDTSPRAGSASRSSARSRTSSVPSRGPRGRGFAAALRQGPRLAYSPPLAPARQRRPQVARPTTRSLATRGPDGRDPARSRSRSPGSAGRSTSPRPRSAAASPRSTTRSSR